MILILPGFSLRNREWANEVKDKIEMKTDKRVLVHEWRHWSKDAPSLNPLFEIEQILKEIENEDYVEIIAKSVGTMICAKLMEKFSPEKIILCGIPTVSDKRLVVMNKSISKYPADNIIVFQNSNDPFASFKEVKEFVNKINKKIKVVEKQSSDHHYPYWDDFISFLK